MNIVRAYAFVRAYFLALVVGAIVWVGLLIAIDPPHFAPAFGLFLALLAYGVGLSPVWYLALRAITILGWPRPLADALAAAGGAAVVLFLGRPGEWMEIPSAALAGGLMGWIFWCLARRAETGPAEEETRPMSREQIAQLQPRFQRDAKSGES